MKSNPFDIVKTFEKEIADYTGAKYAVAVDSCTDALFLCCKYLNVTKATIPSKTYLSVPMSIIHSGAEVVFDASNKANNWSGVYQLKPYPIYDSAKRMTTGMYIKDSYMCLSFHQKKHICIGKGGMILTNEKKAVEWFKRARYEGRSEKFYRDDEIDMLGWNMYMTPEQASRGLALLQNYPIHNEDQVEIGGYRDLRDFSVFKDVEIINGDK
jgi:dTDP-4-amino-4,6-dideoxygalactose transaminase